MPSQSPNLLQFNPTSNKTKSTSTHHVKNDRNPNQMHENDNRKSTKSLSVKETNLQWCPVIREREPLSICKKLTLQEKSGETVILKQQRNRCSKMYMMHDNLFKTLSSENIIFI